MEIVVVALLLYTVVRESFYIYSVNKLINKLMSRNYHEYESAHESYKPRVAIKVQDDPQEDLNSLNEYL